MIVAEVLMSSSGSKREGGTRKGRRGAIGVGNGNGTACWNPIARCCSTVKGEESGDSAMERGVNRMNPVHGGGKLIIFSKFIHFQHSQLNVV
jgi:hypothetical protein